MATSLEYRKFDRSGRGSPLFYPGAEPPPQRKGAMLRVILMLWALAAMPCAAMEPSLENSLAPGEGGEVVRKWRFGREDDQNYDQWPDDWKRMRSRQYPSYLKIAIRSDPSPLASAAQQFDRRLLPWWSWLRRTLTGPPAWVGWYPHGGSLPLRALATKMPSLPPIFRDRVENDFLQVDLNGGAALIQSPPISIDRMYSYMLDLRIATEDLQHHQAWAELVFVDADDQELTGAATTPLGETRSWTSLATEMQATPPEATHAVVKLRLEAGPQGGDLFGKVKFDDVRVRKFPQLIVGLDQERGIYRQGQSIEITARAMGLNFPDATARFTIRNVDGAIVWQQDANLGNDPRQQSDTAFGGQATLTLDPLPPGYYELYAGLLETKQTLGHFTPLAVFSDLPDQLGVFGWTLPAEPKATRRRTLPGWLRACRVGWVKYPCWIDSRDIAASDDLGWLMNRLQESNIQVVGLLDQPPAGLAAEIDARRPVTAVSVFRDPEVYRPLLEPIMARLTVKIRRWQLGREGDASFLTRGSLRETIQQINQELQGYSEPLLLTINWPWLEPTPAPDQRSWAATYRSDPTPLTADELETYLGAVTRQESAADHDHATWVMLDPLPSSQYDLATRIKDLVIRMATIQGHRVQAAFVSDPYADQTGLLTEQGMPKPMLLPWRTTSATIGTLRRIGSLQLPGGSRNIVLSDGEQTVLVVWNDQPCVEPILHGDALRVVDVWGNIQKIAATSVTEADADRPSHSIDVGPLPQFILGLDTLMTKFSLAVQLDRNSIDSLLGREQTIKMTLRNPDKQLISGTCRIDVGDAWEVLQSPASFQLPGGVSRQFPITVRLRSHATTGMQELGLQFTLDRAGSKPFMVYREIRVGPEGLEVETFTRLEPTGELVVTIEMENSLSDPQRYDCRLFPPERQYQRKSIAIPGGKRVKRQFVLADGESLLGRQLLLRAVEQDGRRVLNYTIPVTP